MNVPSQSQRSGRTPLARLIIVAALVGAVAGLLAVYGMGGLERNVTVAETDPACRETVKTAKSLAPLVRGEVAALALAETPRRIPPISFQNDAGRTTSIAEFRGRTVLLNLWATWCVPCRKEMPALDALQRALGERLAVIAVNLDTRDGDKPRKFLKEIGIRDLAYFEDPTGTVFQELKRAGRAVGLPTSILIDAEGCEIGVLSGPAEWASEDALALLRAAIRG